jgi:predicted O-methyltransferase YrrM
MEPVSTNSKLLQLFSLLPQKPREFYNRVAAVVDSKVDAYRNSPPRYETLGWEVLFQNLARLWPANVEAVLSEPELRSIEKEVSDAMGKLPSNAPFPMYHNGDFGLARLCYVLVRIARPSLIVETGVCYGVTSAFLLQALRVNGSGRLHSIDLPPLGKAGDEFVGRLVPKQLRTDWRLHRGRSVDVLPGLAEELGRVDLFLHDSLHTYRNMRREFEIVTPVLSNQAIVVADDVEGNSAFKEWVSRSRPTYSAVLEEPSKSSLLGIAVLGTPQSAPGAEFAHSSISPEQEADSRQASSK